MSYLVAWGCEERDGIRSGLGLGTDTLSCPSPSPAPYTEKRSKALFLSWAKGPGKSPGGGRLRSQSSLAHCAGPQCRVEGRCGKRGNGREGRAEEGRRQEGESLRAGPAAAGGLLSPVDSRESSRGSLTEPRLVELCVGFCLVGFLFGLVWGFGGLFLFFTLSAFSGVTLRSPLGVTIRAKPFSCLSPNSKPSSPPCI